MSDIRAALDALRAAGTAAGLEVEAVNAEARALSAVIAASAPGAPDAWAQALGAPKDALHREAERAEDWRNGPTPLLRSLVQSGDDEGARAYARAITELASAACALGAPDLRSINAAGFVASAQLRAVGNVTRAPDAPVTVDAPASMSVATTASAAATPAAEPAEAPLPTLAELLAQLDRLVGLERVKSEIREQTELLRISAVRVKKGLKEPDVTRHLVFVGNPGTGKSTVARLVAGIYRAVGILSKGQLVETDRSGLVAGYLGQTAAKVRQVVESALGGVLFIDEAYALVGDEYADEAVATLVKAMEDHRDDLVLIVAGYPAPMQRFIESNPGFESRFRLTIGFADYGDDELVEIFRRQCDDADFSPTDPCIAGLRALLARTPRDEGFGNARMIRNVFEAAVVRQAWRLRDCADPTVEQLREMLPEDLAEPVEPPVDPSGLA